MTKQRKKDFNKFKDWQKIYDEIGEEEYLLMLKYCNETPTIFLAELK